MADVEMNMAGLVAIANQANEKIARPLGERIASRAGGGYRVDTWTRPGVGGWARTRVWTDSAEAYRRERRTGALAKSLGSV